MGKRIIFHLPLKIDPTLHSASQIRPLKMLQAFKDIGYEVDVIMGSGEERKRAIKVIKKNIKNGVTYDFLYSESSTMPTLLTESHHLPTHPFLDFGFFKFCKKHGIQIGLFYRDIYWRFPDYAKDWKTNIALKLYNYDLRKYNQLVDTLFVPSKDMLRFLPEKYNYSIHELPSGAEIKFDDTNHSQNDIIELFYVGGIGPHYDLTMLFDAIRDCPNINLTVCCRKEDWKLVKELYQPLLSNNISVIHKSGSDLDAYYNKADMCVLFLKPTVYRDFAIPFKLFEYIGKGKPILASMPTGAAKFVEENGCGIAIPYDKNILIKTLKSLDYTLIKQITEKVKSLAPSHSWSARAKKVSITLGR